VDPLTKQIQTSSCRAAAAGRALKQMGVVYFFN